MESCHSALLRHQWMSLRRNIGGDDHVDGLGTDGRLLLIDASLPDLPDGCELRPLSLEDFKR